MFKYENVSDGAIDYKSEEYFVGIAAVVENASEYRKVRYLDVMSIFLNLLLDNQLLFSRSVHRPLEPLQRAQNCTHHTQSS